MIKVVIIDDHVVVRAGLRYIIEADPELELVGEFGGGLGAADFVAEKNPDVVLMDVRMPDRNGIDALKEILAADPKRRVVMLTTSDAEEDVFRAIEEGALGYVMKESPIETISAAIRSALASRSFRTSIPPRSGMRTSRSTTSGFLSATNSTAPTPPPNSPANSSSASASMMYRSPARTTTWSSMITTFIMT